MRFNKVYIEITNICGLKCSFCPPKLKPPSTMSLNLFESILKQLIGVTKEITYHIVGDPLTLSNLKDYLDLTKKYGFVVSITTTGYYLSKFDLNLFLHPAIKQINFSLNSYNKNNISISFDKYMEPILELCDMKLKSKQKNFINLRIWNFDLEQSEREFNKIVFNKLEKHFKIPLDIDKQYIQKNKFIRLENRIRVHFDNYFRWPNLNSINNKDGYCYGLKSHFGILSDGTVIPCCLDCDGIINLGDLKKELLTDILNSGRVKKIQDNFKNKIAYEQLCKKCEYKDKFIDII